MDGQCFKRTYTAGDDYKKSVWYEAAYKPSPWFDLFTSGINLHPHALVLSECYCGCHKMLQMLQKESKICCTATVPPKTFRNTSKAIQHPDKRLFLLLFEKPNRRYAAAGLLNK